MLYRAKNMYENWSSNDTEDVNFQLYRNVVLLYVYLIIVLRSVKIVLILRFILLCSSENRAVIISAKWL